VLFPAIVNAKLTLRSGRTVNVRTIGALTELNKVGEEIWSNPELGYEGYRAHVLLTDFLEKSGFNVERSCLEIQTAFRATFGQEAKPNICVICEYDALPEIGHAC